MMALCSFSAVGRVDVRCSFGGCSLPPCRAPPPAAIIARVASAWRRASFYQILRAVRLATRRRARKYFNEGVGARASPWGGAVGRLGAVPRWGSGGRSLSVRAVGAAARGRVLRGCCPLSRGNNPAPPPSPRRRPRWCVIEGDEWRRGNPAATIALFIALCHLVG